MSNFGITLALIVALEHFYIMALEMFFITRPVAIRTFWMQKEFLEQKNVQTLFANQGLYNGFLWAGIIFSLFFLEKNTSTTMTLFFIGCVIVAAIFGAITSNRSILLKQGFPAIIAFCVIFFQI